MKDYLPVKRVLPGTQWHVSKIYESSAVKRNQGILFPKVFISNAYVRKYYEIIILQTQNLLWVSG